MKKTLKTLSVVGVAAAAAMGFSSDASALQKDGDTYTMRIGSGHPPFITYVKWMKDFYGPEVEKRVAAQTKYKVKFSHHYSAQVANVFDTLEAVQRQRLDVGGWCVCFDDDKAMAMNIGYYVPFSSPDGNLDQTIMMKMTKEYPDLIKDYDRRYNQKLVGISGFNNYGMFTVFDWRNVNELKTRKILAAGPNLPWLVGVAQGVRTTIPKAPQQIQTGVGEGIVLFPDTIFKLKLHEKGGGEGVYMLTDFGAVAQINMTMNEDTRKGLPKEVVQIMDQVALEWGSKSMAASMNDHDWGIDQLKKASVEIKTITPQAKVEWATRLKDWPNERAQAVKEKKRIDMPKFMKAYIELQERGGHKFPIEYPIAN